MRGEEKHERKSGRRYMATEEGRTAHQRKCTQKWDARVIFYSPNSSYCIRDNFLGSVSWSERRAPIIKIAVIQNQARLKINGSINLITHKICTFDSHLPQQRPK